jgi:serine phosphatase RsbU (regulator of sigma subunit)
VLDATNPEGEFFTEDRLIERARLSAGKDGQGICEDILAAIRAHQSTAAQTDDITMVTVHSNPE